MLRLFPVALLFSFFACHFPAVERSGNLTQQEKNETLKRYIVLKSDVLDTEFSLFDVNRDAFLPGASNKDLKIYLLMKPDAVPLWTEGKDNWQQKAGRAPEWLSDVVRLERFKELKSVTFLYRHQKESGRSYEIWTVSAEGIVLIHYIER